MACLCYRPHTRHVVRMLYLTWKNTHCLSLVRSTFVSMERWIPAFFGSVAETLSEAWEAKPCLALPSGFMYICIYLINFLRLKSLRNLHQVMFASLNFYSYNEDRRHMAFSSWSCHAPKISSLLGLFLFLWLGTERGIMGASFRGVAAQAFSSCSVRTGGPGRRAGDEHPSETVWHCPRWNSLFCRRIDVMMYALPSARAAAAPDAGECAVVRFAKEKAVNKRLLLAAWFLRTLLFCAIQSFPSPAPGCLVAVLRPHNPRVGPGSTVCFLPLFFLICFQALPLQSGMMAGHLG